MNDLELYHYGVKGMKWGRRKARSEATDSRRRGAKKQPIYTRQEKVNLMITGAAFVYTGAQAVKGVLALIGHMPLSSLMNE